MSISISAAILAGGQSSRMGANKAFALVGGRSIIERVIERVASLTDELVIIANKPSEYVRLGLPVFTDLLPGKGPLGGLYTAITRTRAEHTLVVSCDQPFLNPELLRYLINLREGYDVVVPLSGDDYPQSMHAVYGKGCLEPIRRCIDAKELKAIGFLDKVLVRRVGSAEIERFDPDRLSFFNVNTPDDLKQAERLACSSHPTKME
ncbi:MAG: molybdenum cofactor guanylyltransferase [Anaerolineae bacterium]|nr:molybdenum cofactor guanylyltransferase [Anaerolineae bacterium]